MSKPTKHQIEGWELEWRQYHLAFARRHGWNELQSGEEFKPLHAFVAERAWEDAMERCASREGLL